MSQAEVPLRADPAALRDPADAAAHLLVIDDDPASVELFIVFLADYGFTLSVAAHSLQGLAMARQQQPDLILLDLQMPPPDGLEALASLKADEATRHIPVLLLTAQDDVESKIRAFELGAADYVTKPTAQAELQARVTAHLRQQRLMSALERRLQAFERRHGALDKGEGLAEQDGAWPPEQEAQRLYRARQMLQERLADPPSLDELARAINISQPTLSRGFRALFGTTVFGFLREARLRRAHELLTETSLPVKAIALQIGYRNTGDLTRSIKERYGLTPSELRGQA